MAQISLDKSLGLTPHCGKLHSAMSFLPSIYQVRTCSKLLTVDLRLPLPRVRNILATAACLILTLGFIGCETTVSTNLPEAPMPQGSVILSPGDIVKVTFPGQPDYNQAQKIEADGKINLPLVGPVMAAGRTVASLQGQLQAMYASQLSNSEVVVSLDSKVTQVVIAGAVQKPSKYVFDRPTTIYQAVMEAGGPDQFGTLSKVKLTRLLNGQQRTQVFDLRPIPQGQAVRPVYVQSGDVIVVGENAF